MTHESAIASRYRRANVAGAVTIGDGTYVGMGAIVLDRLTIGPGCRHRRRLGRDQGCSAGFVQVMGVPARIV
jgi:acetyltransferase-like isoleucine patch superfamily enzyme